jgi:hypothetical protein
MTQRRTLFVSFDPGQDDYWLVRFTDLYHEQYEIHSARNLTIEPDESAAYVQELISEGYIGDGTVAVVLLGTKTFARRRVDWEIAAALELKHGRASGLLGLRLPTHLDFGKPSVNPARVPKRLAANLKSGFCAVKDWTESEAQLHAYLADAIRSATRNAQLADNAQELLQRDILR